MSKFIMSLAFVATVAIFTALPAYSGEPVAAGAAAAAAPQAVPGGPVSVQDGVMATTGKPVEIKPYRTFLKFERYNMENIGEDGVTIANVRVDITFPNGTKLGLPEGGVFWPIGNAQVQEINRTFEVPFPLVQTTDGFKFEVQMVRKGSLMLPCKFDVVQLSQFNRTYVCHTDLEWQAQQQIPQEKMDKEGIQVRVFTDLNSLPKEVPNDAIALK